MSTSGMSSESVRSVFRSLKRMVNGLQSRLPWRVGSVLLKNVRKDIKKLVHTPVKYTPGACQLRVKYNGFLLLPGCDYEEFDDSTIVVPIEWDELKLKIEFLGLANVSISS